jgi:hypothetical protein
MALPVRLKAKREMHMSDRWSRRLLAGGMALSFVTGLSLAGLLGC